MNYDNWTEEQLRKQITSYEHSIEGTDHELRALNQQRQMYVDAIADLSIALQQRTCQHENIEVQPDGFGDYTLPHCTDCEADLTDVEHWLGRLNEQEIIFMILSLNIFGEGQTPEATRQSLPFFKMGYALDCCERAAKESTPEGKAIFQNILMMCGDQRPVKNPKKAGKR